MVYYVFFSTLDRKDLYYGHYNSEKEAQSKRRFILKNDDTVTSVMVEYRRVEK